MYDLPAVRWANDALWRRIAMALSAQGIAAPASLDRRADYAAVWQEPGLLLSQTCGYPFVTGLRDRVRLVATPRYRAEGCSRSDYRSVLLVRHDDPASALTELRGRRVAFNALDSQSGHNALRAMVAPLARDGRFFAGSIATGAHAASMATVADGRADLCAVDCVTWELIRRHEAGKARALRPIGWTDAAPALPLITAADGPAASLRAALETALADPQLAPAREVLLLDGFEIRGEADYEQILVMEHEAIARGYPTLR